MKPNELMHDWNTRHYRQAQWWPPGGMAIPAPLNSQERHRTKTHALTNQVMERQP